MRIKTQLTAMLFLIGFLTVIPAWSIVAHLVSTASDGAFFVGVLVGLLYILGFANMVAGFVKFINRLLDEQGTTASSKTARDNNRTER